MNGIGTEYQNGLKVSSHSLLINYKGRKITERSEGSHLNQVIKFDIAIIK